MASNDPEVEKVEQIMLQIFPDVPSREKVISAISQIAIFSK